MKFREKAFIVLLAVFVGIFNIGMYVVLHYTYEEALDNVKSRAIGEAYFIRTAITEDMQSLETTMNLTYDTREKIFNSYTDYYEKNQIYLELWNGTSIECSNAPEVTGDRKELAIEGTKQNILIRTVQGEKYLYVAGCLAAPYDKYKLVYVYSLQSLSDNQNQLIHLLIRADLCIMVGLAVVLYAVLYHLMKPLGVLSNATKKISDGNYDITVPMQGKDEFAELGSNFNEMASKVQENMQDLKREAEKKQRLIDNMAHELRTPLTSINGYADYLRMAPASEDERLAALNYIVSESKRLERLSKTILSIADIREGELQGVKELSIDHLVEEMKALFHNRKVRITYQVDVHTMMGNEEMVVSLISNLIENAIRASEEEGNIYVRFEEKEQLMIQIQDEGVGMTQEEISMIEEPFYRVDKARSRKSGGVGLGVSLCKQIVQAHQAKMMYESEKGKGTKVTLLWPIRIFTT